SRGFARHARGGDGQGVRDRGGAAHRGRRRADPGRGRRHGGASGRAALPRGALAADLRRNHRDPAPGDRPAAPPGWRRRGAPVKAAVVGAGPAGLFFAALLKKSDPRHEGAGYERNRLDDTFGFGVVFSDATEQALEQADPEVSAAMIAEGHRWDDIEIHYRGRAITSTGHAFSGLSRKTLLRILADRCRALGVRLCLDREVEDPERLRDADLVLAADGANSTVRERYREHFRPTADVRPNKFVWLGTSKPFPAFTFYFKPDAHGLW